MVSRKIRISNEILFDVAIDIVFAHIFPDSNSDLFCVQVKILKQ